MADRFEGYTSALTSPGTRHYVITPSDTTDLDPKPRGIRVLVSGDVAIRDEKGVDITYPVTAGETMGFRAVRVLATGTTATVVGWD